jgi:hypothetical protein
MMYGSLLMHTSGSKVNPSLLKSGKTLCLENLFVDKV